MFVKKLNNIELDELLDNIAILIDKRSYSLMKAEQSLQLNEVTEAQYAAITEDINVNTYSVLKQLSLGLS